MPSVGSATVSGGATEEFWDDLLAFIEDRRVVPVVGAELSTISVEGREVPLYRALAEKLLAKYGLRAASPTDPTPSEEDVLLRTHLELNDAVSALAQRGRRVVDLYRPINDLLRGLTGPQPSIPPALRHLAGIPAFSLFVSTACDDLLCRALDEVRSGGTPVTEQIAYAPNLPGEQLRDIPDLTPSHHRSVLYLFGRASPSPFYAIDDEDVLEFVYNLQSERGSRPERMLRELRRCHLILLGCNFSDWLSRFFIRLANQGRLSGARAEMEFLVGDEATHDRSLTLFLERFSHNTRVYPGEARDFITELVQRWAERHPPLPLAAPAALSRTLGPGRGEIFVSYSRTDLAAAKVLSAELDQVGAGVIWFDKSVLHPGDEWEQQITAALKRCDLFLALVSGTTEERTDAFFHKEWDAAIERSRWILGRTFIIPVVLDADFDGDISRYRLVPERFQEFQYAHAPGGRMSDPLRTRIIEALRELRRRWT